jgi:ubiquinone/menaquinone biosynthesis C-methylase UbiE
METYLHMLKKTHPMREPVLRQMIEALSIPVGSRGLDVGCGIGLPAMLFADAAGEDGHVTGLDLSEEFINHAGRLARKAGYDTRVIFRQGDFDRLQFDADAFDWAVSIDCVGNHPADPLPALRELSRVVKPGGTVALMGYASQHLLPGHPFLEARLNATPTGIAPFTSSMSPERHFSRALGWFDTLGFEQLESRTFIQTYYAPLAKEIHEGLALLIDMRWGGARAEIPEDDWREFERLCMPDSTDFILNRPDYTCFFTYMLFKGSVPV